MRNLKSILPMLAFVLAIGMSFAFTSEAPGDLVVEIEGEYYQSPINCDEGAQNCTTRISKDGIIQEVQVLEETALGNYEPAKTANKDRTVYQFSSLEPINP